MKMNEPEIQGLTEILRDARPDDVMSIMETTTKHMIRAENLEEAIKITISYTDKASTLLRRRKLKKTTIFEYLRKHGILVPVDGEKTDYIKACLNYWQSPDKNDNIAAFLPENTEDSDDILQFLGGSPQSPEVPSLIPQLNLTSTDVIQLGIEFSGWFFNCLNTLQDFGPHHFWPDCKMWLNLKAHKSKEEEFCIIGSESVVARLSGYITNEKLFFNPNTSSEAVRSMQEEHGMVKVKVSGVIHQFSNCVGLFDSGFGLINDPASNYTWKIKSVHMSVQNNNPSVPINTFQTQMSPYLC